MKKKRSLRKTKKTRTIIITVLSILAVAYFAISRLPKAVPLSINEVTPTGTVTLSLPPSVTVTPGVETTLDMSINTGGAQVTAVQVELNYDQSKLGTPVLTQGDFLTDKLGNPKVQDGRIFFVFTIPLGSDGKSGQGKLATLKFKPTSNSQIIFTQSTMVAAIGAESNVLKSASGSTIQVSAPGNPTAPTPPAAPPILTTTPQPPTPSNPTPTTPTTPTTPITTTTQSERVFDETGNFDYSKPAIATIDSYNPAISTSAFARFLAFIKSIFGAN